MSNLDRELREALERGRADELGQPRRQHYRDAEPSWDRYSWGAIDFLKPATPWHLAGLGAVLFLVGRFLLRSSYGQPVETLGVVVVVFALLSLAALPRSQPKRWRGRLIELDESWRGRAYRWLFRK